jgi:hypothetical protein
MNKNIPQYPKAECLKINPNLKCKKVGDRFHVFNNGGQCTVDGYYTPFGAWVECWQILKEETKSASEWQALGSGYGR